MNVLEVGKRKYKKIAEKLNPHPLQSYSWGELKKPGWDPLRLEIKKGKNSIGLVTILQKTIPLINKDFGYIPRGICVKYHKYYSKALEAIDHYLQKKKLTHLIIDPNLPFSEWSENKKSLKEKLGKDLSNAGFKLDGNQIQPNRSVIIDLTKSKEAILKDMRSKHRQYIRKSVRKGITIRRGNKEDLKSFFRIIDYLKNKKGYLLHSHDYYRKVWEYFSKTEQVEIFIASQKKKVVGSYIVLFNSDTAFEMYGGCTSEGNNLLAGYLMKWESIRYAKRLGKKFYDQWGAEYKYPGLVQFKEGFGGDVINFPSQHTKIYNSTGYRFYNMFIKINELRQRFG